MTVFVYCSNYYLIGRLKRSRLDTCIRQPRLAKMSDFKNPTYAADHVLIGRLKTSEMLDSRIQPTFFRRPLPRLSQEEPVIRQLAAQKFRVELHQDFVKLQNLVLHFAAFGYRQPRTVQAHD